MMIVKICGLTRAQDVEAALAAGADWLGFNLVPSSPRFLTWDELRPLVELVGARAKVVLVVANQDPTSLTRLLTSVESFCAAPRLQLHGDEPAELVRHLAPAAFKAVRLGTLEDVEAARDLPGHPLLVDAKVAGQLGGTGQAIPPSLVVSLARERPIVLAGGLRPETVAGAIAAVSPWGVDVASGVEPRDQPRHKDPHKLNDFVIEARRAFRNQPEPR